LGDRNREPHHIPSIYLCAQETGKGFITRAGTVAESAAACRGTLSHAGSMGRNKRGTSRALTSLKMRGRGAEIRKLPSVIVIRHA
jgi:hypothetical protein